ncbi:excalibur calcium-binding domain-containing protein [Nocardia sp. NPDC005978]|uniref:excalibur calcium-binding domain-containing protein n=1 Tax=Nocardia sp. NPDC005978 TaxID=3156725 RepID=UPI0033BA3AAB
MTLRHRALMAATAVGVLTVLTACGSGSPERKSAAPTTTAAPAEMRLPTTTVAPTTTSDVVTPTTTTVLVTTTVPVVAPPVVPQTQPAAAPAPAAPSVSYKNCAAVKAAGAAPLRRGDPGYSTSLDRDGDGIACEK